MFSLPFRSSSPKEAPNTAPEPEPAQNPTAIPTTPPPAATQTQPQPSAELWPSGPSRRSAKQLGLFVAGAGFLAFSTLVTRRAVVRKQVAAAPKFYQPSHRSSWPASSSAAGRAENPEGSMIALEALNLATLNVVSFAVMAAGGLSWAFDVSSVEDLRGMARRHITGQGGKTDEAAEREIEEWAARVLLGKGKTEDGPAAAKSRDDQPRRKD